MEFQEHEKSQADKNPAFGFVWETSEFVCFWLSGGTRGKQEEAKKEVEERTRN